MLYLTQLTGLVFVALINGEVAADCPAELNDLELDPPELVVRYGEPVSVSCRSLSNYTHLNWSVPLETVSSLYNQTVTWETDSLTDWEIQPECYMILDDVQCSKTLPLTVYKPPDRVLISTVGHTGTMTEGKLYELQCDIQNVAPVHLLTVNWYKGPDLVNTTNFTDISTKIPVNQSTRLKIFPSRDDEGVQYSCEAKLNLGPKPSNISDPLIITKVAADCPAELNDLELDPAELVVRYGEPVSVSCRSASNYTHLNWSVPLGTVLGPENQTVTWETDNLTDWEIQPVCYMMLNDTQCSKTLPITVYKIPDQVSISIVNQTGPMTEGKKYELQCDIQNFAPVNVLAVSWYNGDKSLKNRGFTDLPTKTPSNKTVTLKVIASRDEGEAQYRCEAKMKLGLKGSQSPPIVKSNLLDVAVHSKPVITCSDWSPMINTTLDSYPYNVTGNPSPNITWYRDKSSVSTSICLSRNDSGQYKYVASNVIGSASCVTKITVEYAPTFTCPAHYEGMEHESFLDKCSVMASPTADITWEKDGKIVNPLHNLTREDSGSYLITAVNKHGTEKHNLTINVLCDCPVKIQPVKLVVEFGDSVSANCSTTTAHKGMGWEASEGAVHMMQQVQNITWRVENITHWDIKPICFINVNSEQCELGLSVTVYKHPDRVSISTVNHTGPMIEGREYELQCDVQNVAPVHLLTVSWYKGQHLVKRENFSDKSPFPFNKTTTLQISPSRDDEGVQYRCEAELNLGPEGPQPPPKVTSDPLNITVYFGPELSNCPGVVHLNEGASLAGYCLVTGKPFPDFYWKREESVFDPTTPLNRNSSGEYKIIINKNVTSLTVEVIYGPEISCGHHFIVQEDTYFTPNCTVNGFPQITENWYKDEDDILSGFPRTMYRNAAGNYTLIASNNYSNVSHVIQIEVWYPPSEISELQNENVSIGKDVVLKCVSYANPRPSYRWIYHQTSNVRIVDEDGVSRLHITNADGENTGTYMCIVTNVLEIKNKTVRVDVQGAKAACPLSINPQPVVLAYGSSHNVTCESSVPSASLSWKYADKVLNESTLVINSNLFTDMLGWSGKASCLGHFVGLDDCQKDLNVIIYKRPDKVSISASSHAEPMIEGENYTLQCNIQNVAPVQFLTVNWYKGQDLVKSETDFETKDLSTINTTLVISPSRKDNKKQYSCETVLKLGPQSLCENKSDPLNIAVHYKPAITDKLPPRVPVFHGYPVVLICEASGYPEPSVAWIVNNNRFEGGNLTVKDNGGDYTCIANNSVGSDTRVVQVVQKEDYLPLIAGFVALVVVIISVFFISIYSIYYKNTKMGRYTVEGAKPKAQNGNVAQNGKDGTIPMKKIMV